MPLEIIRNDITQVHVDAIVNAANESLLSGGGVDGAIHRAAGPELLAECRTLGGCKVGEAKITKGYRLPTKHVIHTVGPVWRGGKSSEDKLLADCYRNSLALAREHNLESIAFPLISTGAFGYPKDKALKVAIAEIGDFLLQHEMTVYLVVFDRTSFALSEKLFASIAEYIDDNYIDLHPIDNRNRRELICMQEEGFYEASICPASMPAPAKPVKRKLADVVKQLEESFSQMLLRLIDEKGMSDAETYKKANIDRKLFSKIRNDIYYKPSKPTVFAFAIALRLNLDETRDLLGKAGFAISHSSKFDLIVQFFIEEGKYNIFEINEALFAFEQPILGN
jgi:O-acetyl-ADP-ribose deacetylase (regulator of RNase III)